MLQLSATEEEEKGGTLPLPPPARGGGWRRRGVLFWLFLSFLTALAAPVLVYLTVLAYVACGFLKPRAAQTISLLFDAPASIASVRTEWLRNLRIAKVAVRAADKTTPLTVDNITLDWDLGPFLSDGRIRTATIERPEISLRRNAEGQWNIHPNLAAVGGRYRLEQVIMREGDLSIEWPAPSAARLRLQALSGTYTDQGPLTPKAFSLYGVWDSLESISVTGSFGPGQSWNSRAAGGLYLERDLAGVLGPAAERAKGHVRYDISGWGEVPAKAGASPPTSSRVGEGAGELAQPAGELAQPAGGGPALAFGGQFIIENLHCALSGGCALDIPNRTLDVGGTTWLNQEPGKLATFDKLQLRMDGIGTLSGQGALLTLPGVHLDLQKVRGRIDVEAANELFLPRLWGDGLNLTGSVAVSGLAATLPLAGDAPPAALQAEFETHGLRAAFPGMGQLPPWDVKGRLELKPELTGEKVRTITLKAELQATAAGAPHPPLSPGGRGWGEGAFSARIRQSYFPHEAAPKRIGPIEIEEAVWPLAGLEQFLDLRRNAGLTGNGTVRLRNATFYPATGEASGTIELENADLVAALPRGVQEAVLSALKMSSYDFAAPMFERNPTEAVSFGGLNVRADVLFKDKRLTLKNGRTRPCELRAELPWVGKTILATLPSAELGCELDAAGTGRPSVLRLKLDSGTKLEVSIKQPPSRGGEGSGGEPATSSGAWAISGALGVPAWGGLSASFSVALDLLQRQIGPTTIILKELDLSKAEAVLHDAGIERPAGRVKDLEIELEPYSLRSLAAAKTWRVSAVLEDVGFSSQYAAAERLSGNALIRAEANGDSVAVNSILRLNTCAGSFFGEVFSLPPGQNASVSVAGKYTRGEKGADVKLEELQVIFGDETKLKAAAAFTLNEGRLSKTHLDNATIRIGKTKVLTLADVNGELPIILKDIVGKLRDVKE